MPAGCVDQMYYVLRGKKVVTLTFDLTRPHQCNTLFWVKRVQELQNTKKWTILALEAFAPNISYSKGL